MFSRQSISVGVLAAAALLLESTMTRLLAVTQFYHFAFLVISLALLGYGASGTLLVVSSRLQNANLNRVLLFVSFGFTVCVGIAYGVVNLLPFDSYAIAWDRRQIAYFILYYLVLTLPFLMSGLATGAAIAAYEGKSHLIYAANLLGSGLGALAAPIALSLAGVPGTVLLSGLMGLVVGFPLLKGRNPIGHLSRGVRILIASLLTCGLVVFFALTFLNLTSQAPLGLTLSPYKGLAQASRHPNAEIIFSRWNAISRIDVVQNAGTHLLPGLSYVYRGRIPDQLGLSLDADSLQPLTLIQPEDFLAADFLPEHLVFELRPGANTLVFDPKGGLGVLQALAGGAREVTAVVENPLWQEAVQAAAPGMNIYKHPQVRTFLDTSRSFIQQTSESFDILYYPLTDAYRPITSGAYSLSEDYALTVETFEQALKRMSPTGIIAITRWIQVPPSESLRMAGTLMEALTQAGYTDLHKILVLYRGIQTMTFLVKPSGWTPAELAKVRAFTEDRKFDLVWVPDIQPAEVNRYNLLPQPMYYQSILAMLSTANRSLYYDTYPFNITPPTDDYPFFFHFFRWEQTRDVLATIGYVWQPFGGSGYLVTFALLGLTTVLSGLLILLPLIKLGAHRTVKIRSGKRVVVLAYFTLLGLAFMFVEIPLIQQTILVLNHPTYAFTAVVVTILLFSSLGSALARRWEHSEWWMMGLLVCFTALLPIAYPRLVHLVLGWQPCWRVLTVVLSLAPTAILMGLPFPLGLKAIESFESPLIPWAWAVNGSVSVVASVLAAILVLSYGFTFVLLLGGGMYAGAAILFIGGFKDNS